MGMLALKAKDEPTDARKIVRLGGGELLLRDGSVHAGTFSAGAAHGPGVYYDRKGAVHAGRWVTNFRCGAFSVIDPAGGEWADTYDDTGKRSARKKVVPAGTGARTSAVSCRTCSVRFHPDRNYRCRRHKGVWQEATQKWLCCDAREADDPGCHFGSHEPAADPS